MLAWSEPVYALPCTATLQDGWTCDHDLPVRPYATEVTCRACGTVYDAAPHRAWLLEASAEHLGTATEVAGYLTLLTGAPVPAATVRCWAARGRLSPVDHAGGRPRYRLGDAAVLARVDHRACVRRFQAPSGPEHDRR